jgi:hypothetical protein
VNQANIRVRGENANSFEDEVEASDLILHGVCDEERTVLFGCIDRLAVGRRGHDGLQEEDDRSYIERLKLVGWTDEARTQADGPRGRCWWEGGRGVG